MGSWLLMEDGEGGFVLTLDDDEYARREPGNGGQGIGWAVGIIREAEGCAMVGWSDPFRVGPESEPRRAWTLSPIR